MSGQDRFFDQFSPQSRRVLARTQKIADSTKRAVGSEHLLLALASIPRTIPYAILKEYAITIEQIRLVLSLNNLWNHKKDGMTAEVKEVLKIAVHLAAHGGLEEVEPEHLLAAVVHQRTSRAFQVIARVGVDPRHLKMQLDQTLRSAEDFRIYVQPASFEDKPADATRQKEAEKDQLDTADDGFFDPMTLFEQSTRPQPPKGKKLLEEFTINLTRLAHEQQLDPLIGREREVERAMAILARRRKNNPVLVGEPGVGKTALVEGIASRIGAGLAPDFLKDAQVLQLDLALLVAGTMYRGQFEERLKRLIHELERHPQTIVFVDELHTLVGTGSAEGSMDAANILKPVLARGSIRLIGATTPDEYRRYIEKDSALERRFQVIPIDEPTPRETTRILEGLRPKLEAHHGVKVSDTALQAAVSYAVRYIHDRRLPDKAIDLIDEAAAGFRASRITVTDTTVTDSNAELDRLRLMKEKAIGQEQFDRAATLRRKELRLVKKIESQSRETSPIDEPQITETDILRITSRWTGIPEEQLGAFESERIRSLASALGERIIAQDDAITRVSAALKRSSLGLRDERRPLGSFLFLGPTGVGKTELARGVAAHMFGNREAFIKLDMSEFMERHAIARLIGAPAGYVGYEDGGKLTEVVRKRPYSLILFDEIEKAHPDFQHTLLQILEDGVLTDAQGRTVSFRETILILTSNLGPGEVMQHTDFGFRSAGRGAESEREAAYDQLASTTQEQVKDFFRPEFLNRLDDIIVFRPLALSALILITEREIAAIKDRLQARGIELNLSERAVKFLAEKGYNPEYGARSLKRVLAALIENKIADHLLTSGKSATHIFSIGLKRGELVWNVRRGTTHVQPISKTRTESLR